MRHVVALFPSVVREAHVATPFVALLRAVNVGGPKGARAGKLPMSDLKRLGETCGFAHVRTYIASCSRATQGRPR